MGNYINWDAVANRYPDTAKGGGAFDSGSSYIAGAEAELNARLSARYTVPFSPAPALVMDLAIDLTYARMTVRQKESQPIYDRALSIIKDIVNGTIPLVDSSGSLVFPSNGTMSMASNSYRSAFGPDEPLNWSPSESAILDAQLGRDND